MGLRNLWVGLLVWSAVSMAQSAPRRLEAFLGINSVGTLSGPYMGAFLDTHVLRMPRWYLGPEASFSLNQDRSLLQVLGRIGRAYTLAHDPPLEVTFSGLVGIGFLTQAGVTSYTPGLFGEVAIAEGIGEATFLGLAFRAGAIGAAFSGAICLRVTFWI